MGYEWNNLHRLQECGDEGRSAKQLASELEREWYITVSNQEIDAVPAEALDEFFARAFPSIEFLMKQGSPRETWWPRLCSYFKARREFRKAFRPPLYRQADRAQLARFKVVFDVWDLCVSKEGRNSGTGCLYQSYRLELAARLAPTWNERERLYLEAAETCLNCPLVPDDPLCAALQRRGLVLDSHSLRVGAFYLLNRTPPDLPAAEDRFAKAVERARAAQNVWFDALDTHVDYLGFWAEAIRLRRAEVEGDLATARSAYSAAGVRLESFGEPENLFTEPNFWHSVADFRREQYVIDILQALKEGPHALTRAVELSALWLKYSRPEMSGTLRLIRMELRHRALDLLETMRKGADVGRRIPGLFEELGKYPAVGRHTWEIAKQVELASKGRQDLAGAVAAVCSLFPIDAQAPTGGISISRSRWNLLPHWYQEMFARYRVYGEAEAGVLVLVWYSRVVADYVWSVYVKNLVEQRKPKPSSAPDFLLAPLFEVQQGLKALAGALCWSGFPGRTLDNFIDLLGDAMLASPQNVSSEILPAVVEETALALYPMPLRVEHPDPLDERFMIVSQFNGRQRELRLSAVANTPPSGTYVYIKPRFKPSEALVKQDKSLTLYPAPAFAEPLPTTIICEGVTDQAVLRVLLDYLEPLWHQLDIKIIPAEGDGIPATYKTLQSERPIVMADADKRYGLGGKPWNRMWETCCYSFVLEPDLERISYDALAAALCDLWRLPVTKEELRELSETSRTGKEFEERTSRHYAQTSFKSVALGMSLGQKLVEMGIPATLREAVLHALQLANGRRLPCRTDPATPFHHCAV